MESAIRILAGSMVLISLAMGRWVNPNWYWLGVFVAVNLIQSALTGFCPAEKVFAKAGIGKKGSSCCG